MISKFSDAHVAGGEALAAYEKAVAAADKAQDESHQERLKIVEEVNKNRIALLRAIRSADLYLELGTLQAKLLTAIRKDLNIDHGNVDLEQRLLDQWREHHERAKAALANAAVSVWPEASVPADAVDGVTK